MARPLGAGTPGRPGTGAVDRQRPTRRAARLMPFSYIDAIDSTAATAQTTPPTRAAVGDAGGPQPPGTRRPGPRPGRARGGVRAAVRVDPDDKHLSSPVLRAPWRSPSFRIRCSPSRRSRAGSSERRSEGSASRAHRCWSGRARASPTALGPRPIVSANFRGASRLPMRCPHLATQHGSGSRLGSRCSTSKPGIESEPRWWLGVAPARAGDHPAGGGQRRLGQDRCQVSRPAIPYCLSTKARSGRTAMKQLSGDSMPSGAKSSRL
jgi:hypothetical protein